VVLPLSSDPRLAASPLAWRLAANQANGLKQPSFVMTWLPTTVASDLLEGPLGRVTPEELAAILILVAQALDLRMEEPWSQDD
jgi:hypothetical protein